MSCLLKYPCFVLIVFHHLQCSKHFVFIVVKPTVITIINNANLSLREELTKVTEDYM